MGSDFWKSVPGAQITRAEREMLRKVAQRIESKFGKKTVIVNIGVMWGCTMHCLRAGAPNARLVGVDNDYKSYKVQLPGLLKAKFIEGDSNVVDFDGRIHLLLIDGDHHYKFVRDDILNWVYKVVAGGIVAFHDYAPTKHNLDQFPHIAGVKKAVNEWMRQELHCWHYHGVVNSIIAFEKKKHVDDAACKGHTALYEKITGGKA